MKRAVIVLAFLGVVSFLAVGGDENSSERVRLLFFGDINLGRTVGQWLLEGKEEYPFEKVRHLCQEADVVFANLESIISEQNGETVSPASNIVFCAPPVAAKVLRNARITVVSLANNHAFDYGEKGLDDAKIFLDSAGVFWTGIREEDSTFHPVIVERNGVRIGFVAYTETMNFRRGIPFVSMFDTTRARRELAMLRTTADVIIASYHGGTEYADRENLSTRQNLELLAEYGATLVVGHHPHVVLGIHRFQGSFIAASLGNFVFYQPQKYWTRYGIGLECVIEKRDGKCTLTSMNILPLRAGYQPTTVLTQEENNALFHRLKGLSNVTLHQTERGYSVEIPTNDD